MEGPEKKKAPRAGGTAGGLRTGKSGRKFSDKSTATEAQIAKLIARLRRRPHHTHELRMCGISHPAGRVLDLAKRGFVIDSSRVSTVDSDGFTHVGVALYELLAEPFGGDQ